MKKYLIALLALITLTAVKCQKADQEDQLPPITTTGANTFGCKVNGTIWLPYTTTHDIPALWVGGSIPGQYYKYQAISITANNTNSGSTFDIYVPKLKDTGTYAIYNVLNEGLAYSDGSLEYEPFDTFGIVKILRLDTIADIVSGTFSFIGTNKQANKVVNITDGRFDVHWPYKN